jgi:ubiquinone/menaquinone biosynthesis C-methylase UbiE
MLVLTQGRERRYRAKVLDLAGVAAGTQMLDIGCGTGTLAIAAWQRSQPGGQVLGTDISKRMVDVARRKARRAKADVEFRRGDAMSLPFDDAQFDLATVSTVMHAVPDERRTRCLVEAKRVLKPAGRLIIIDFGGDLRDRRHWTARLGPHGAFDLDDLRKPLAEVGFRNIESGSVDWLSLHFLRATNG